MPKAIDEALDRDERERERRLNELELEPDATSLTLLQQVYRNASLLLATRMRAAGMAIQFEHAKLGVSVNVPWSDDMATRLERAVARSSQVLKLIEYQPPSKQPKVIEAQAEPQSPAPAVGPCLIEGSDEPDEKIIGNIRSVIVRLHPAQGSVAKY